MADPFTSAVQSFSQFNRQGLANRQTQQTMEMNQLALDSENASRALNEFEGSGLVQFNSDTNSYMVAPDWYQKLQKIPETERQSLLAGVQSFLGAYEDKGKIEVGQISSLVPVKNKLPTSLQDASEEEKQAWLNDKNNVAYTIPIKRKDGVFSFLTRNRSSDPSDDEAVILSGSQVASWIGARANKLNRLRNPEAYRAGAILTQEQESLSPTGTGKAGVTFDTLMDELTNELDRVETNPDLAGTGAQTDSLGQVLSLWETTIDENLKQQYNQQNVGSTPPPDPRVGQRGIEFKEEKQQVFKGINKEAGKRDSKLPLLKGGGGVANITAQISGILDGSVSGNNIKYPTGTVLYNFWKSKEGNESFTRNSKEWKTVTNDAEAIKKLAEEYLPAARQQISDAGFDLRYLEDYTEVGDVRDVTAPMVETDFPETPDLTGITTKEQALELLDSGTLSSLLTEDVITKSRNLLQEQGITDSQSFNQAVQEGKIKDPFVHSLIIANAIAGPGGTQSNIRAQAIELFNNIKTGDPKAGPESLVMRTQQNRQLEQTYRDWLSTQNKASIDRFEGKLETANTSIDAAIDAFGAENFQQQYAKAEADILGALAEIPLSDEMREKGADLGLLRKLGGESTFQRVRSLISGMVYTGGVLDSEPNFFYGIPIRQFDKDFWGDILAADDPGGFANYADRLAWRTDSEGKPVELVVVNRVGGRTFESEEGIDYGRLERKMGPKQMRILRLVIPPLTNPNEQP